MRISNQAMINMVATADATVLVAMAMAIWNSSYDEYQRGIVEMVDQEYLEDGNTVDYFEVDDVEALRAKLLKLLAAG